ncbi:hypothetical protein Pfo_003802 [Paulownia fortunei]|nr:hypothetical protein Pfo_003802 [Paulownia fortunei]
MNGAELVANWLTPTVLFCILNLMIGSIFITSSLMRPLKKQRKGENEDEEPAQLVRVPSLFERVRSTNLSMYRSERPDPAHNMTPAQEQTHHREPEPEGEERKSDPGENAVPAESVLNKSAREKLPAEKGKLAVDRQPLAAFGRRDDEAVDAKADDFIKRFKQQLKLQRLDSILRYKEMLNRGMGR